MKRRFHRIFEEIELRRIRTMERYKAGSSKLLGRRVDFVDCATFIHGFNEIFRNEAYRFYSDRRSPFIIDCGSNIGLSIIFFKNIFPNARIIGFEPDREIFRVLERNVARFEFGNVELHNQAVWKENQRLEFRSEGGYSGRIALKNDSPSYEVRAIDLNPFLEHQDVDFLKLDIEGAEYDVISSIENNLNNVRNMFVEYHSPKDEAQKLSSFLNILERNNFRYYINEAFNPSNPFMNVDELDGMDLQLNISCIKS